MMSTLKPFIFLPQNEMSTLKRLILVKGRKITGLKVGLILIWGKNRL